jgi:preprotein translocase subunit SecY
MSNGFQNIGRIPELKRRIIMTFVLLFVYRIGVHIPTPGIDGSVLSGFMAQQANGLFGMWNMLVGGGFERLSVFALGIMPYISSSIIIQILGVVIPALEKLQKEGEAGRRKIMQYTRYGTVVISLIQGGGIAAWLSHMSVGGTPVVYHAGWSFSIMTVITLTAGTMFLMWLGEQITEKGIGNGISLIIFSGIVGRFPNAFMGTIALIKAGTLNVFLLVLIIALMIAVIGFIIYMETSQRRIPVQYAKRVVGRKMYGGQSTHLPLKINQAGVIPPIFASSLLVLPATMGNLFQNGYIKWITGHLVPGGVLYEFLYVGLIIFFCFFYTSLTFNPDNVADNMKKYGGYIPGIRPGKKTADFIERILSRITFTGAIYISFVCILPSILMQKFNVPFYFGGTSLLIVVGVGLDTIQQVESHLILRHYDGLVKKSAKMRGRR